MTVVVVSVPSVGVVKDGRLTEEFLQRMAKLHEDFPNISFIVPMIQGYALLPHLKNQDATWQTWSSYVERLIKVADELWIFQYPGYKLSIGVAAEKRLAIENNKLVYNFVP